MEGSPVEMRGIASRSSIMDSFKGCGISGMKIDKEELKRMISIPGYLGVAMAEAIRSKEPNAAAGAALASSGIALGEEQDPLVAPMVVFVNSRSGGRHGAALKGRLQELMGEEQVVDLSIVKPSDFVQYGLGCLEKLADLGDNCAKATREKLRVMVAGGDGTVGWVLGSLGELFDHREPVPPTGIIPLGTGNDLSRSFGWGGSFPFAWRSAVKRYLYKAISGPICRLDSWHVVVSMPAGETVELPPSLRRMEGCTLSEDVDIEGTVPEEVSSFEGVFYNYFSIGMDAQVAYGFHHLRNTKPYLAQGPIANKDPEGAPVNVNKWKHTLISKSTPLPEEGHQRAFHHPCCLWVGGAMQRQQIQIVVWRLMPNASVKGDDGRQLVGKRRDGSL